MLPSRENELNVTIENESTLNFTVTCNVVDGRLHPLVTWDNPSDSFPSRTEFRYQVFLYEAADYFAQIVVVNRTDKVR